MQILKHHTTSSIFQTIVKLINIYWVFKIQAILWSRDAKIGAPKVDKKIDFKEEPLQNTYETHQNYWWAIKKRNIGPLFLSSEMIRGDRIGVWKCLYLWNLYKLFKKWDKQLNFSNSSIQMGSFSYRPFCESGAPK